MTSTLLFNIILTVIGLAAALVFLKTDMQMLQQNSYRNDRYWTWLRHSGIHNALRTCLLALVILLVVLPQGLLDSANYLGAKILLSSVTIVWIAVLIQAIKKLRTKQKKALVFTARVKRLYATTLIVTALIMWFLFPEREIFIAPFTFLILPLANWINHPIEWSVNRRYYNDAKRILAGMPDLTIVGITGSYGKTSTKHYLHRILSEKYMTLMTPGSFNTTLGVVRTIREQLKPYHQVFVVEMGAKQIGDIKEICDLVNPTIGVVTAVAEQHLDSFKTLENVLRTKFELIDALPFEGFAVVNNDFPAIATAVRTSPQHFIRYAMEDSASTQYHIEALKYAASGTEFSVVSNSEENMTLSLRTSLVGEYNISNLMAAVIVARELGLNAQQIRTGVAKVEQVEHRLTMRHTPGGITIIDDAYNSNPYGARMALDVLSRFEGGRRIVITPGMIELGDRQYFYNHEFGKQIASSADYAMIVGQYNAEAILSGVREAGMDESKIFAARTFNDASAQLQKIARAGDVVLYENDLPDMFK